MTAHHLGGEEARLFEKPGFWACRDPPGNSRSVAGVRPPGLDPDGDDAGAGRPGRVAAMVLPALQGPLDDQRLLKSADLIRAQWTKARVTAMKNGRMYVFRYVTASDEYAVEPWSGEVDTVEASQHAPRRTSPRPLPRRPPKSGTCWGLPASGCRTASSSIRARLRRTPARRKSPRTARPPRRPRARPPPIVFYPDGSTSDARLVLTNERFFVQITLRGLTGMVRVSELLSSEELSASGGFVQ